LNCGRRGRRRSSSIALPNQGRDTADLVLALLGPLGATVTERALGIARVLLLDEVRATAEMRSLSKEIAVAATDRARASNVFVAFHV
jgi:hypothetical protein